MKLIVLAAGDAFELDGFNKLFIKHPVSKKTIIEQYVDIFKVEYVNIVVGYRAIEFMNEYPQFKYFYNRKWQSTGNSYSLALALDSSPCYVVSSDFILTSRVFELMAEQENCAIVKVTENRLPNSINAEIDDCGNLKTIYRGKSNGLSPELPGIFKITNPDILIEWKRRCLQNPSVFAAENLPFDIYAIRAVSCTDSEVMEINYPEDYIKIIEMLKNE